MIPLTISNPHQFLKECSRFARTKECSRFARTSVMCCSRSSATLTMAAHCEASP